MEEVSILIETGNDAFADEPASEIARILRKLADDFENGEVESRILRNINGNNVGFLTIS